MKIIKLIKTNRLMFLLILEFITLLFFSVTSFLFSNFRITVLLLLSIISITVLCIGIFYFVKKYIVEVDIRLFLIISIITAIVGLIIYLIFAFGREMEYIEDHTCYFNQQHELQNLFIKSHIKGIYAIINSFWRSDYSYFINIFLAFPYFIFPKTNEFYIAIYYVVFIIPVIIMNNILLFNLMHKYSIMHKKMFLILGNITILFFPLLHFASLLGMPDIFGMFFVLSIIVLFTVKCFEMFSYKFSLLLAIFIISLVLARRWYLFWLIGFMPMIFVKNYIYIMIEKNISSKSNIINLIKTFAATFLLCCIVLSPFIYHTLIERNYNKEYAEYYIGGFPYEIYNQAGYLGILMIFLMLSGIIYGLYIKKLRIMTLATICGFFLTVWSFTLVQNMGKHQSLCVVGYYIILLYILYIFIDSIKNSLVRYLILSFVIGVFALNVFSTVFIYVDDLEGLYLTTKYAISSRFTWVI